MIPTLTKWNKGLWLVVVAVLLSALPHTQAQPTPQPDWQAIATDPTGTLILTYPNDWGLTQQSQGFRLEVPQREWALEARVTNTQLPRFEALPDWLVESDIIPPRASFSQEDYNGWDAWLAQGQNLRQNGQYIAWVALPLGQERLILLDMSFPNYDLSSAAASYTTLLNQMLILPISAASSADDLRLGIPRDWVFSAGAKSFLLAPSQADWERLAADQAPDQVGVIAALSSTPPQANSLAVRLDEQPLTVNGASGSIQLWRDEVNGVTEIILERQIGPGLYWQVTGRSQHSQSLLDQTAWIKAIFASFQFNIAE